MANALKPGANAVEESTVEARSGVTGHGVRYVLAFGTFGVVVAFILVYFAFFR